MTNSSASTQAQRRARELAGLFATLPEVVAVALSGSQASAAADQQSDIDLYVFTSDTIAPTTQAALIDRAVGALSTNLNLPYWGGVHVWIDPPSGIMVDCMYFSTEWIAGQVARVMDAHEPSLGYSTSFCRTVQQAHTLHDPHGWFASLQARARQPYPDALRHAIIAHNHPVLRTIHTSYLAQIESALRRDDAVSVNHRVAALLASYFDILFALNRVLHPGEKRLLAFAHRECALLPEDLDADIAAVLAAAGTADTALAAHLTRLLDRLDALLGAPGVDGLREA